MDEMNINEPEEQENIVIDQETGEPEDVGSIKISVDVVSTIAGIAATQTPGVAQMYSSFAGAVAEKFGAKKNPSKGVKVEMSEGNAKIDLYIVVEYGVRIPELAWEVQESVKNNVETMTGLDVTNVNIHIEGVSFKEEQENDPVPEQIEAAQEETEEEITD